MATLQYFSSHSHWITNEALPQASQMYLPYLQRKRLTLYLPIGRQSRAAWQRPTPTLRQGCTCRVPTGDHAWHLKLKLSLTIPKGRLQRQKWSQNLGRPCIWAELHETGRLFCHLERKIGWDVVIVQPGPDDVRGNVLPACLYTTSYDTLLEREPAWW